MNRQWKLAAALAVGVVLLAAAVWGVDFPAVRRHIAVLFRAQRGEGAPCAPETAVDRSRILGGRGWESRPRPRPP